MTGAGLPDVAVALRDVASRIAAGHDAARSWLDTALPAVRVIAAAGVEDVDLFAGLVATLAREPTIERADRGTLLGLLAAALTRLARTDTT